MSLKLRLTNLPHGCYFADLESLPFIVRFIFANSYCIRRNLLRNGVYLAYPRPFRTVSIVGPRAMCALVYATGAMSMNPNLTTVTVTLVVLGLLAAFDIVPGAGFYAGVVMLAIGAAVFTVQLIGRNTPLLGPRASSKANGATT